MHDVEEDLRQALRTHEPTGQVPVRAALVAGRRARLARRAPAAVAALVAVGGAALALPSSQDQYQLVGDGLTLSQGAGVQQIDDDRVDMGDGIQAWREGEILAIGYPTRPYAAIDTTSMTSRWDDLGYDIVVFDEPGEQDGSTMVVGTVRGTPTSVEVVIDGVSQEATVACFTQVQGWCSYKANVITSWQSHEQFPEVIVK